MKKAKVLTWELIGAVVISLLGTLLHYVFALLGEWPPAALIAAVNESVWEHLKLAFWPALIYALIEWPFFRKHIRHFWAAKAIGIFAMPVIITSIFYSYTAFTGHHILWVDISSFVLAVFAGQMISCGLLLRQPFTSGIKILTVILWIMMIAAFSLFTFFPPHAPLFYDHRTDHYGIMK